VWFSDYGNNFQLQFFFEVSKSKNLWFWILGRENLQFQIFRMTEPFVSNFRLERTQFQVFENFQRTGSFHERTSKELVVLLLVSFTQFFDVLESSE
jgi:hypothetical protein